MLTLNYLFEPTKNIETLLLSGALFIVSSFYLIPAFLAALNVVYKIKYRFLWIL